VDKKVIHGEMVPLNRVKWYPLNRVKWYPNLYIYTYILPVVYQTRNVEKSRKIDIKPNEMKGLKGVNKKRTKTSKTGPVS
jgi:hypothetical protein